MSLELSLDETKDYFIFADVCADGQVSSYPVAYLQWAENDLYVIHGFGRDLFNAFSVNSVGSDLSRTIVVHINDTIKGNLVADSKWIRFHAVEWNVRYGYSIEQDIGGFYFISIFDNFNRQGIPQKLHDAIDGLHNTTVPQLNKTFKTDAADIFNRQYQKMFVPVSVKNETKNIEKTQETQGGMFVWSPSEYSEGDVMKVKARIFTTVSEGEYVSDDGMLVEVAGFESDLSGGGIIPEGEIEKIFSVNTYNAGLGRVTISMEVEGDVDFERQVPAADLLTGVDIHLSFGKSATFDGTDKSGHEGRDFENGYGWGGFMKVLRIGKFGSAVRGNNDSMLQSSQGNLQSIFPCGHTKDWSISAWVRTTSNADNSNGYICYARVYTTSGVERTRTPVLTGGKIVLLNTSVQSGSVADGQWHHVAATHSVEAAKCALWVDGVLVGEEADGAWGDEPWPSDGEKIRIGSAGNGGIIGDIDEVTIWGNRAITRAEVKALYNDGDGLPFEEWSHPQPVPAADLLTGLSHHWALGENAMSYASSVAGDTKNIGSITSPTAWSASGRIGGCVAGANISGGNYGGGDWPYYPFGTNRTLSLSLWLRMDSASSASYECGFMVGRLDNSAAAWVGFSSDRKPCVFQAGAVDAVKGTNALSVGWHHFVLVGNAGALTCYCDGEVFGTATLTKSATSTINELKFGRGGGSPTGCVGLNGAVDEISVWLNRAITQDEVTALYNGGAGLPFEEWTGPVPANDLRTGLVAGWDFADVAGSGNNAGDIVGGCDMTGRFWGASSDPESTGAPVPGGGKAVKNSYSSRSDAGLRGTTNLATDFSSPWSMAIWVMRTPSASGNYKDKTIFYAGNSGPMLFFGDGDIRIVQATTISQSKVPADNTWHHIAVVCDSTMRAKYYIDGEFEYQEPDAFSFGTNAAPPSLGVLVDANGMSQTYWLASEIWFTGAFFWSRALTEEQVTALYNGGNGLPFEEWT